jgi:glutamyl-tRNA reductase
MLHIAGCTYHRSAVAVRERLAFSPAQIETALTTWKRHYPETEAVLLSTCNRVELYSAAESPQDESSLVRVATFLAEFHCIPVEEVQPALFEHAGEEALGHLFRVAASLDSMVVGEPQILAQVKQAYDIAHRQESVGPVLHQTFQAAIRVARRVASETAIHQRRVSIPSVAIADFASQIFEEFSDKEVVVIGAGDMAEETLRYLRDAGAQNLTVVNRSPERARQLADRWQGRVEPWQRLHAACIAADLVISTTARNEPIVTRADYDRYIATYRDQRPLMILDLAIPRDFDPHIADALGVYLYSIDDLTEVCQQNRQARDKELPAANRIIDEEAQSFMTDLHHRATVPVITQLRAMWQQPKQRELERLLNRLPDLDADARQEIAQAFDRLVNKLLHPALESLRHASRHGPPQNLLDALKRLFQLKD